MGKNKCTSEKWNFHNVKQTLLISDGIGEKPRTGRTRVFSQWAVTWQVLQRPERTDIQNVGTNQS